MQQIPTFGPQIAEASSDRSTLSFMYSPDGTLAIYLYTAHPELSLGGSATDLFRSSDIELAREKGRLISLIVDRLRSWGMEIDADILKGIVIFVTEKFQSNDSFVLLRNIVDKVLLLNEQTLTAEARHVLELRKAALTRSFYGVSKVQSLSDAIKVMKIVFGEEVPEQES
ncbi:hypothetical protein KC640_03715 [Candidatus Dojkabacteria bacterium]|uniref:Uncharacterized protein n=1 Tax=Candidatus Dojkabacteria bacterium TaxID=2099670 RepID=A0A955I6P6_9BACT|nr:hypothetical protein [Candidatus Dojkabacteria bacterium]